MKNPWTRYVDANLKTRDKILPRYKKNGQLPVTDEEMFDGLLAKLPSHEKVLHAQMC